MIKSTVQRLIKSPPIVKSGSPSVRILNALLCLLFYVECLAAADEQNVCLPACFLPFSILWLLPLMQLRFPLKFSDQKARRIFPLSLCLSVYLSDLTESAQESDRATGTARFRRSRE